MKSLAVKFFIIFLGVLVTGCAGTDFVRVADSGLVLGKTTPEQIIGQLGPPYREGLQVKNNQQMKTLAYGYGSAGGEADAKGVTAVRSQGFYFYNNTLVGYEFTSSWKKDSTDFDNEKVLQIKKGESTQSDVMRLIGNPGGKYIYPVISADDEYAVNYMHTQVRGFKNYQEMLVVTFNKQGTVSNVEFTESGEDPNSGAKRSTALVDTKADLGLSENDFTGSYRSEITGRLVKSINSNNSRVRLVQSGKSITGTFGEGGKIWGDVEENIITFTWYLNGNDGKGKWTFDRESHEVVGSWFSSFLGDGSWNLSTD